MKLELVLTDAEAAQIKPRTRTPGRVWLGRMMREPPQTNPRRLAARQRLMQAQSGADKATATRQGKDIGNRRSPGPYAMQVYVSPPNTP
jgi:hypothetical protein